MLDDKYKELNEELSGFNKDLDKMNENLELTKKNQLQEFLSARSEIKSGKKYSKLGGFNWWFKFKLFFWRLLMSFYY